VSEAEPGMQSPPVIMRDIALTMPCVDLPQHKTISTYTELHLLTVLIWRYGNILWQILKFIAPICWVVFKKKGRNFIYKTRREIEAPH